MRHVASLFLAVAILTSSSCTRSAPSSESGSGGDERGSGSAEDSGTAADEDAKPIVLTDARLDKYLAFRKEFNRYYAGWIKDAGDVAKSVDSKSTEFSKAISAVVSSGRLGEKYEKELRTLRAKHGFTEDEDDRLWSAITEVVAAKVLDNPFMEDSFKSFREMQAKGGEEKKAADELLKNLEDQEKQGLAEARKKYGDACVDVLSKRVKDLGQFQVDSMNEFAGQLDSEKK
jgi:hypothetical protein